MQIAILGAGRIGSAFAYHLARAGHRVSLIARGARLEALLKDSAVVAIDGTRAAVHVAAELPSDEPYDVVFVTVLAVQVEAVLPSLSASAAKRIVFLFNTFGSLAPLREAVGPERFVMGFPNMIAFLVDGTLRSVVKGPGMVTTVSSEPVARLLKDAGMPSEVEPDMASYLRSHAAFVVPTMVAAQWTWRRNRELTWTEAARLSDALHEALALVRSLGHTLKPRFVPVMAALPGLVTTVLLWLFARSRAVKDLGAFGPGEVRALIDAMAASAPGKTPKLLAIRP